MSSSTDNLDLFRLAVEQAPEDASVLVTILLR